MASKPREVDAPGRWHHVSSRAVGRRPYFETDDDHRYFLERCAEVVEEGRIEIHAFCLMPNHFHLLVRSCDGRLSDTFRDLLSRVTRRFNERRERDGPLVKGRFFSRVVHGAQGRIHVVRYIDDNPPKSLLVACPTQYAYGSARHYASGRGPAWLSRYDVEETVRRLSRKDVYDPTCYASTLFGPVHPSLEWLIERELLFPGASAPFDELVGASEGAIAEWWIARAKAADGLQVGYALAPPEALRQHVEELRAARPAWRYELGGSIKLAWNTLAVGLIRTAGHASTSDTALLLGTSRGRVGRCLRDHWVLIEQDPEYRNCAARILQQELQMTVPSRYLLADRF